MLATKNLKPREKRKLRIRNKISGTVERPRLCIYRSLHHLYAQVIDDTSGNTLCAASTASKELKGVLKSGKSMESAKSVGKLIADKAKAKGITKVVFDRNGYKYHGRVKMLADSAREAGLIF